MQVPPTSPWDEAAYLELERSGSSRHEFLRGELYAMEGGSLPHSQRQVNLILPERPERGLGSGREVTVRRAADLAG